jgi:hypothetical protein
VSIYVNPNDFGYTAYFIINGLSTGKEEFKYCVDKETPESSTNVERQYNKTYDEDEVEVVDEGPLDGVVVLVVDLGGGAFFDEDVLDEVVDGRGLGGAVCL